MKKKVKNKSIFPSCLLLNFKLENLLHYRLSWRCKGKKKNSNGKKSDRKMIKMKGKCCRTVKLLQQTK